VRFFRRMESLYPGRDFACTDDDLVRNHGPLSIRYGRGVYMVMDLTNRCNMKCTRSRGCQRDIPARLIIPAPP
jgi:hypothetical protein